LNNRHKEMKVLADGSTFMLNKGKMKVKRRNPEK
jgi:hypothetical protein